MGTTPVSVDDYIKNWKPSGKDTTPASPAVAASPVSVDDYIKNWKPPAPSPDQSTSRLPAPSTHDAIADYISKKLSPAQAQATAAPPATPLMAQPLRGQKGMQAAPSVPTTTPEIQAEEIDPQTGKPRTATPPMISSKNIHVRHKGELEIGPQTVRLPELEREQRLKEQRTELGKSLTNIGASRPPSEILGAMKEEAKDAVYEQLPKDLQNLAGFVKDFKDTNFVKEATGKTFSEHYDSLVGGLKKIAEKDPAHFPPQIRGAIMAANAAPKSVKDFAVELGRFVPGILDFFSTPEGIAAGMLPVGAGGNPLVQRFISAGFTADMVPAAVESIQESIDHPSPENFARALTSTWMAYGVTKHTIAPFKALTPEGTEMPYQARRITPPTLTPEEKAAEAATRKESRHNYAVALVEARKQLREEKEATAEAARLEAERAGAPVDLSGFKPVGEAPAAAPVPPTGQRNQTAKELAKLDAQPEGWAGETSWDDAALAQHRKPYKQLSYNQRVDLINSIPKRGPSVVEVPPATPKEGGTPSALPEGKQPTREVIQPSREGAAVKGQPSEAPAPAPAAGTPEYHEKLIDIGMAIRDRKIPSEEDFASLTPEDAEGMRKLLKDYQRPQQQIVTPPLKSVAKKGEFERVNGEFSSLDDNDDYYYHVTTAGRAKQIMASGALTPGKARSMAEGFYSEYSKGKVFFSERDGVSYWQEKIGNHLESQSDNAPPKLVVLRFPKTIIDKAIEDEIGSKDSGRKSFYAKTVSGKPKPAEESTSRLPAKAATPEPPVKAETPVTTPPPGAPKAEAKPKEPWEMTRDEYVNDTSRLEPRDKIKVTLGGHTYTEEVGKVYKDGTVVVDIFGLKHLKPGEFEIIPNKDKRADRHKVAVERESKNPNRTLAENVLDDYPNLKPKPVETPKAKPPKAQGKKAPKVETAPPPAAPEAPRKKNGPDAWWNRPRARESADWYDYYLDLWNKGELPEFKQFPTWETFTNRLNKYYDNPDASPMIAKNFFESLGMKIGTGVGLDVDLPAGERMRAPGEKATPKAAKPPEPAPKVETKPKAEPRTAEPPLPVDIERERQLVDAEGETRLARAEYDRLTEETPERDRDDVTSSAIGKAAKRVNDSIDKAERLRSEIAKQNALFAEQPEGKTGYVPIPEDVRKYADEQLADAHSELQNAMDHFSDTAKTEDPGDRVYKNALDDLKSWIKGAKESGADFDFGTESRTGGLADLVKRAEEMVEKPPKLTPSDPAYADLLGDMEDVAGRGKELPEKDMTRLTPEDQARVKEMRQAAIDAKAEPPKPVEAKTAEPPKPVAKPEPAKPAEPKPAEPKAEPKPKKEAKPKEEKAAEPETRTMDKLPPDVKVKIPNKSIKRVVGVLKKVLDRKMNIPILQNAAIISEGGRTKMVATDLQVAVTFDLGKTDAPDGATTISVSALEQALKGKSKDDLEIETTGGKAALKVGGGTTSASTLGVGSYPDVPQPKEKIGTVPAQSLVEGIKSVISSISPEETRFTLNGALLKFENGVGTLVATDGHRLTTKTFKAPGVKGTFSIMLPRKAMSLATDVFGKDTGGTNLTQNEDYVALTSADGSTQMVARKLTGNFPDYSRVMPDESTYGNKATVDRQELLDLANRAVAVKTRANNLYLSFRDGKVSGLLAEEGTEMRGDAKASLEKTLDSGNDNPRVALNATYLRDFLASTDADKVEILIKDKGSAVVLRPEGDATTTAIIMPMRAELESDIAKGFDPDKAKPVEGKTAEPPATPAPAPTEPPVESASRLPEQAPAAGAPKKTALELANEARKNKHLNEKVQTKEYGVVTRGEWIKRRVEAGGRIEEARVPNDALRKKVQAEYDQMKNSSDWVPTGNQNHPRTIKYNALKAQLDGEITKPEYRLYNPADPEAYNPISKTDYDYARSVEAAKAEAVAPTAEPPVSAESTSRPVEQTPTAETRTATPPGAPLVAPSILEKLVEAGKESDKWLHDNGILGGESLSANRILDPQAVYHLTRSVVGDVARGAITIEEAAKKVWRTLRRTFDTGALTLQDVQKQIQDHIDKASALSELTSKIGKEQLSPAPAYIPENLRQTRAAWGKLGKDVAAAWDKTQEVAQKLWADYRNKTPWTSFDDAVGRYDGQLQFGSNEAMDFVDAIHKAIPDKLRREGLVNYAQANGDMALLEQRAKASTTYRPGYEAAMRLNPAEQNLAKQVRTYFNQRLDDAQKEGMLKDGVENYVNQIWERNPEEARKLYAAAAFHELEPNPAFLHKRFFETYFEGEQAGFTPRDKDIGSLIAIYDQSFNSAIASRRFIDTLHEGVASDGRPIAEFSGKANQVIDKASEVRYFVKPKSHPKGTADYLVVDHPALRGWKWATSDLAGNPIFVQGDMLVHPEYAKNLQKILGPSKFNEHPSLRVAQDLSRGFKQTLLSLSPFHQVQIGVHALEHRVNPFRVPHLNLSDATQRALVNHGLVVANFHGMAQMSEGVTGSGVIKLIPILNERWAHYQDYLFRKYIPRIKMSMAMHALERNRGRYRGKLSEDQILALTARQANAAFGGLNYRLMARSKTFQDAFGLFALAPDFLEARARFVGQALKPGGKEQLTALAYGAISMAAGKAIIGQITGEQQDWDLKHLFYLRLGGREYGLRTIQGDIIHLITDPNSFVSNRINPAFMKPVLELGYGRDQYGRKRAKLQQLEDYFKTAVPIPFKGALPDQPQDFLSTLFQSTGIQSRRYNSAAAMVIKDYYAENPSREPSDKTKALREVTNAAREGDMEKAQRLGVVAIRKGLVDEKDLNFAIEKARKGPLAASLRNVPWAVAVKAFEAATPEEKQQIGQFTAEKLARAMRNNPQEFTPEVMQKLQGLGFSF